MPTSQPPKRRQASRAKPVRRKPSRTEPEIMTEGRVAFTEGVPLCHNPYGHSLDPEEWVSSESHLWADGWTRQYLCAFIKLSQRYRKRAPKPRQAKGDKPAASLNDWDD